MMYILNHRISFHEISSVRLDSINRIKSKIEKAGEIAIRTSHSFTIQTFGSNFFKQICNLNFVVQKDEFHIFLRDVLKA